MRVERQLVRHAGMPLASSSDGGVIALRAPKRTVVARPSDIVALRADGDFTHVLVADQPALMMWRTLGRAAAARLREALQADR